MLMSLTAKPLQALCMACSIQGKAATLSIAFSHTKLAAYGCRGPAFAPSGLYGKVQLQAYNTAIITGAPACVGSSLPCPQKLCIDRSRYLASA